MIKTILWDFNGTVMNDVDASTGAVNAMLARRGLPLIDREWYTLHLVMPLERFYSDIGFDMEAERIEVVSAEFQRECAKLERPVFLAVAQALERFRQKGYRQLLFSSLFHDVLMEQVKERGIEGYFEEIVGRRDRSLGGKEAAVSSCLQEKGLAPVSVLIVGDLTTDWEMAKFVGCPCALTAQGHQHRTILEKTGAFVLEDASELDQLLEELK